MTETCEGQTTRHRAPLPPVEVKEISGHEKFPSWPAATGTKSNGMSAVTTRPSKSWAEQTNNPKEQPPPIVRPYPKRLSNGLYTQQLKTVMERCEKGKREPLDSVVRSMKTKSSYVERPIAEKNYCVPLTMDSDSKSQLTQAQLEKYSRAYDDSPHRETDEYSSCFDGSDSMLSSHLTKEELEHYTRIYEEKSTSQISLTEKVVPSHQHQTSYAQSEGYHSYVSSTDSTSTPFLDRLRRENESVVVVSKDSEKPTQGRDSSASSGSSSETLKWHGSNSDLSTVSNGGHRVTTQHIAHSAKVSAPQRHHSETVQSVTENWSGNQENRSSTQRNLRKLFPVSTYTVQPAAVMDEKLSPKSPPALSVAERINELEKQQQQLQASNKLMYYDPEKKHKVTDQSLRAIQKQALLSFYERHQSGSSWRSEPQLSPPPRPPPIPSRPRLPTPLSRRSSISSEYDTPTNWNDDCSKDDTSTEDTNSSSNSKELNKNQHRSSSCGSLSTAVLGPMVLGPSISIDDWVPELPPKKKSMQPVRQIPVKRDTSPDLPPPPPMVNEENFISDEPLPPPPPEAIWPKPESLKNDKYLSNGKEMRLENSFSTVEDVLRENSLNEFPEYKDPKMMSEKSKSLSYIFDNVPKAMPQAPAKLFTIEPTTNGTDEKLKEFGRSLSVRRNKLTIPNKDYCRSEFSARKSVFQGGSVPKQVVMSTVKPPAFSATTVQNNLVKHQICTPLKIAREADKSRSLSIKKVVGPLKASGVFPPSLEPSCPPTLYQQSQSKASYLSAYKREPREREKGLPNFEGSYKRTASPNGGRGDTIIKVVETHNVENVAPVDTDFKKSDKNTMPGVIRLSTALPIVDTSQSPVNPAGETPAVPIVLTERPVVIDHQQQQQPQHQMSKTLPRNNPTNDFKRSSRTPRTQSDPSNMPGKDVSVSAFPIPHSESTLSLQKRSQSDLSQVGSTESGYSSLSLNAPSPSHSPTRLSSGDFSTACRTNNCVETQCDLDESRSECTWYDEPLRSQQRRHHRPVSRSCSSTTTMSDAASQTDLKSSSSEIGTPVLVRKKLPEEIECEELSRDLISHLSPSDKLHNILAPGPDVKRSTDYVSLLFRMDLVPRSRASIAEKPDCNSNNSVCDSNGSLLPTSSYYTISEPKAKLLNNYNVQKQQSSECNGMGSLQKKKADLVSRLDRKLKVLREEQVALIEETTVNEALGVTVFDRVKALAKTPEANKFKTHVQEVGHITSLLLSLSGRLAKVENALLELELEHPEKKTLEEKKSKLTCQLEEAKELKENIDRRGDMVSTILSRYLTSDEFSDYDHFIAMKAKLLIDAREISDKIQLGEEQLCALKETLED
ncbi:uncharacterized protein LOC126895228 isoform X2 [Daktulosphaira vitifoliae]|nr:uncharacterized protein LOC126895228 isoform X2 [Daktulosphaira vitifoliae]